MGGLTTGRAAGSLDAGAGGGRLLDQAATCGGLLVVVQALHRPRPATTTAGAGALQEKRLVNIHGGLYSL